MLIRNSDLSGCGGGFGAGGGSTGDSRGDSVVGAGSGAGAGVAQALSKAASARSMPSLVTQANPEYVNLCSTQAASEHIEFVEVVGWPDVNPVVVAVVELDALNVRLDTLQRELGTTPVRVLVCRE